MNGRPPSSDGSFPCASTLLASGAWETTFRKRSSTLLLLHVLREVTGANEKGIEPNTRRSFDRVRENQSDHTQNSLLWYRRYRLVRSMIALVSYIRHSFLVLLTIVKHGSTLGFSLGTVQFATTSLPPQDEKISSNLNALVS